MKRKKIVLVTTMAVASFGLVVGSLLSVKGVSGSLFARAQNDVDWGHYTALKPTSENPGSKEFWVSCSDHSVQFTAPTEYREIFERGAPTLEMVQEWGALDDRYLAPFDSTFSYLEGGANVLAWGESGATHVYNSVSADGFGISAAKVNALITAGYTSIAFDWSVDWDAWGEHDVKDEIVFYDGGFVEKYFNSVGESGTFVTDLVADTFISAWLQRNPNGMPNQEFVISNVRLFCPAATQSKMYTANAWTSTGSLAYDWVNGTISTNDTWSLYFSTSYATELYNAGYRTMTATFTVTGTTSDYLTSIVNGVATSYKNGEAEYTLTFLIEDLATNTLQVRTNNQDVTGGDHNTGCTGNGITISNIGLSIDDLGIPKQRAKEKLSKMFYSESNCWNYFHHNGWGANSWGADCAKAVFGTAENGQPYFLIQNNFFQDMKLAGYTSFSFHVKAEWTDGGAALGNIAVTTSGGHLAYNAVYKEYDNVYEADFSFDVTTFLSDMNTSDYLTVAARGVQPGCESRTSILTLSRVVFSVGAEDIADASIKEFYTEKQVRRVEQQDEWKSPIGSASNEVGHAEYYKFGRHDVIHLSAHYASDDPKFTYNNNWSEWRFQHQKAGLTSVTFTYLYEDSNSDLGNDGVSDVHTMAQWYGAAYQGRTMTLNPDGEWHTITVTGAAYDTNFFVMKIYHFTGDIYISNIIYE